jgi:23S rRNA (cytosine1962-C5)-methyltransferase
MKTTRIDLAQGWRDYTLIDCGGGEKLERWGNVTVIRPDPLAIWPRDKTVDWGIAHMRYKRSRAGGGMWSQLQENVPESWTVSYDKMRFHIRPTGFKHMGLFPEQAVNWRWMQEKIRESKREIKVLNLFAYTGGATVACLQAGANVTHIDAAKGMNQWAKDNITLSGLGNIPHRVLTDDVLKFVYREGRRGNKYDAIVMDPPVFGRGPDGEMWKLEEKLYELVTACQTLLSGTPLFLLINAYTAGYSPVVYENVLKIALFQNKGTKSFETQTNGLPYTLPEISTGEVGLQAKSGSILPCGMYARAMWP